MSQGLDGDEDLGKESKGQLWQSKCSENCLWLKFCRTATIQYSIVDNMPSKAIKVYSFSSNPLIILAYVPTIN